MSRFIRRVLMLVATPLIVPAVCTFLLLDWIFATGDGEGLRHAVNIWRSGWVK